MLLGSRINFIFFGASRFSSDKYENVYFYGEKKATLFHSEKISAVIFSQSFANTVTMNMFHIYSGGRNTHFLKSK